MAFDPTKLVTADDKFEARKVAKVAAAEAHDTALQQIGFPYDFGATYGVLHLQLRGADDKVNWLAARAAMDDAIAAGYGDVDGIAPIHTKENVTAMVSPNEGVAILVALNAWATSLYQASWAKKAAIRATTNDTELDAIDVAEGWNI